MARTPAATGSGRIDILVHGSEEPNQVVAPEDVVPITVEATLPERSEGQRTLGITSDFDFPDLPTELVAEIRDGKRLTWCLTLAIPRVDRPLMITLTFTVNGGQRPLLRGTLVLYVIENLYKPITVSFVDEAGESGEMPRRPSALLSYPAMAGGLSSFNFLADWQSEEAPPVIDLDRKAGSYKIVSLSSPAQLSASVVTTSGAPAYSRGRPLVSSVAVAPPPAPAVTGRRKVDVYLQRSGTTTTRDMIVNQMIRASAQAMSSGRYFQFIDDVFCGDEALDGPEGRRLTRLRSRSRRDAGYIGGVNAYEMLKTATQAFLVLNCGVAGDSEAFGRTAIEDGQRLGKYVDPDELSRRLGTYLQASGNRLPYLDRIIDTAFPDRDRDARGLLCHGLVASRVESPCLLELIWSYWHEEGMLVQTLNAISRRFQNVRAPGGRDPLAHLEIDPLRPLNGVLWGYIQDEWTRLSVQRRAYEYDHQYGLPIYGRAVPGLRPADSRSKFLEAFHNLLHRTYLFFKEDNDTTVIADGYPLLNSLKEVHLLLAQGAHNQFGDLPWTARVEMLMQQWILARPEMRDFLQSRPMVPYVERWMPAVDTMKTVQGWSDVTVTHFRDLGVFGEQILLSVRWGDWIGINDENSAKNWARYWRPEIQGYIHAYRAVTGADLSNAEGVDFTPPSVHLRKRLALQRAR